MKAMLLESHAPMEEHPLRLTDIPKPVPKVGEVLLRVSTCGICHTDLHIIEGEVKPPSLPLVVGHQVVGEVEKIGEGVENRKLGERVGVPWLYSTCGRCSFCQRGEENLCEDIRFTGCHENGGLTEYMVAPAEFVYPIPRIFSDIQAAPLLCAGIIGYRALRISEIKKGEVLGLFGFGASAHIAIQVAMHWDTEVFVFTRSENHRDLARELGAAWVGGAEDPPPKELDRAIIFAPAGYLIPLALKNIRKGGTLALAGIYMDRVPEMPYDLIYGERKLVSVANSTREDAIGLLEAAAEIPILTEVEAFRLEEANEAYLRLKRSEIKGAGVIVL
ncbi:MAG: zinc-dependent alcohol dehydrogenase family protein [Thermoplasmata archaeon]|nr:zinc-dependent alcohol dehydrogenase family protein [Thermoplasmata archaeon]